MKREDEPYLSRVSDRAACWAEWYYAAGSARLSPANFASGLD
jgi:hypothetical protein